MDSTTKTGLIIGGSVLGVAARVGGVYFMSSSRKSDLSEIESPPQSRTSSFASDGSLGWGEESSSAAPYIAKDLYDRGGKRRRKTSRNVHRLKLSKKKTKRVRRSH